MGTPGSVQAPLDIGKRGTKDWPAPARRRRLTLPGRATPQGNRAVALQQQGCCSPMGPHSHRYTCWDKEGSGACPHRKAALKGKGKQVCISHLCLETLSEGETEFRHSIRTAWALVDLPRKLALRVWGDSDVVPSWSGKHTTSVRAAGAWSQRTMALPRSSQTILLRFAVKKTSAFAEVHPMLPSTCLEWGKPSQWVMAVGVRV